MTTGLAHLRRRARMRGYRCRQIDLPRWAAASHGTGERRARRLVKRRLLKGRPLKGRIAVSVVAVTMLATAGVGASVGTAGASAPGVSSTQIEHGGHLHAHRADRLQLRVAGAGDPGVLPDGQRARRHQRAQAGPHPQPRRRGEPEPVQPAGAHPRRPRSRLCGIGDRDRLLHPELPRRDEDPHLRLQRRRQLGRTPEPLRRRWIGASTTRPASRPSRTWRRRSRPSRSPSSPTASPPPPMPARRRSTG